MSDLTFPLPENVPGLPAGKAIYSNQDLRKDTNCSVNIGNNYQNTPYIEAIRKSCECIFQQ